MAMVIALCAFGCGGDDWKSTSMNKPGEVIPQSMGGFIAETENYIYYINGSTSYGDDNEFGTPVKGALMAAEKSTLGTDNVKTEIVIPKLFVASDYSAGVYIYDGYVYYGSPSTEKNNSGLVASSELTFAKTKLDGTNTKTYFTVDQLSYTYRFVKNANGQVCLVYYDAIDQAIKCFNTVTEKEVVVAKTDVETSGVESLKNFVFLNGTGVDGAIVAFTTTIYAEKYSADKSQRAEETYNKLYVYGAGDAKEVGNEFYGKAVLKGSVDNELRYEILLFNNDALFYSESNLLGETKNYAIKTGATDDTDKVLIKNAEFVSVENKIIPIVEGGKVVDYKVYAFVFGDDVQDSSGNTVASSKNYIVETSLCKNVMNNYERLAKIGANSKLVNIISHGDKVYAYYVNSMTKLARVELTNQPSGENAGDFNKEVIVSTDSIASAWYMPEFVTCERAGGAQETFVFYLDNTTEGASYVHMVKVYDSVNGVQELEKDTNDDGTNDTYYIEGQTMLGKINKADKFNLAIEKLKAVPSIIDWEEKDGKIVCNEKVQIAVDAYNKLMAEFGEDEVEENYGEANMKKLNNVKRAARATELLAKLDNINNYSTLTEAEQTQMKADYNTAKAYMNGISYIDDVAVLDMIENNLKWAFYEKAPKLFG